MKVSLQEGDEFRWWKVVTVALHSCDSSSLKGHFLRLFGFRVFDGLGLLSSDWFFLNSACFYSWWVRSEVVPANTLSDHFFSLVCGPCCCLVCLWILFLRPEAKSVLSSQVIILSKVTLCYWASPHSTQSEAIIMNINHYWFSAYQIPYISDTQCVWNVQVWRSELL